MKRKPILKLNILIISAAVPLLIFSCAAISLVSYLAFYNLDAPVSGTDSDSGPVRIRTISELESGPPAQVTNESEPASVIEDDVPEAAIVVDVQPVVEVPVEPAGDAEVPTGPSLEEEAEVALETITSAEPEEAAEAIPADGTLSDTVADDEVTTASPQDEEAPAEELPVVELPVEPASSTRPLPEIAANPAPPRVEPPAPSAPSEPTFVPDSSFFDQLLEQVD